MTKKKNQKNRSSETKNSGGLGGNLNGIAVALLTTLVTEVVQQVLDRLFNTHGQTDHPINDQTPDRITGAEGEFGHDRELSKPKLAKLERPEVELDKNPVAVTAGAVGDRISQAKPLMQDVLKTIQTTVQEATPRLNEAIAVLQASSNDPKQAVATLVRDAVSGTKETLQTAAPNLNPLVSGAMTVAGAAIGNLATVSAEELEEDKPKKKKDKKKKGKKSKK